MFQFSIGDAGFLVGFSRVEKIKQVSILYWRCGKAPDAVLSAPARSFNSLLEMQLAETRCVVYRRGRVVSNITWCWGEVVQRGKGRHSGLSAFQFSIGDAYYMAEYGTRLLVLPFQFSIGDACCW